MNIKKAIEQYFKMRREAANSGLEFLFKTPEPEESNSPLYIGELDDEGYIEWKPVEKLTTHELTDLEDEIPIRFHHSIKEYFNAYWFADLDGFINENYIKLEPVIPNYELNSFKELLKGYQKNHQNNLDKIPIGLEGNGLIVLVDNKTGEIILEDFERKSFNVIKEDLQSLILSLNFKKS